ILWSPVGSIAANSTTATDSTALPGTLFYYRVRAFNGDGSSFSSSVGVTTPGPPSAPTNLAVQALSPTQVKVSWTDASTNEGSFELQRSLNNTIWNTIGSVGANS